GKPTPLKQVRGPVTSEARRLVAVGLTRGSRYRRHHAGTSRAPDFWGEEEALLLRRQTKKSRTVQGNNIESVSACSYLTRIQAPDFLPSDFVLAASTIPTQRGKTKSPQHCADDLRIQLRSRVLRMQAVAEVLDEIGRVNCDPLTLAESCHQDGE